MNDSVASDAFVMPSSTGSKRAGSPSRFSISALNSSTRARSICSPRNSFESPGSVISTFCSIWRTITSMCLSLIFTPCSR